MVNRELTKQGTGKYSTHCSKDTNKHTHTHAQILTYTFMLACMGGCLHTHILNATLFAQCWGDENGDRKEREVSEGTLA